MVCLLSQISFPYTKPKMKSIFKDAKKPFKTHDVTKSCLNTKSIEAVVINTRFNINFIISDALIKLRIRLMLQNEFHTLQQREMCH